MKRIIAKSERAKIFGMSMYRKNAISMLERNADTLATHILKCVIYSDTLDCYNHWINDEIAEYISIANDITVKPKNKKLKSSDYERTIFSCFADSHQDALILLRTFRINNSETNQYPGFEITHDLIEDVYDAFQSIKHKILPLLCTSNNYGVHDFSIIIHNILDRILR